MEPTDSSAQLERNKDTVRRMLERINAGDVAGFVENLAPNYQRHSQAMPPGLQEMCGKAAMREWLSANAQTFPDYREDVEWLVAEGDFVAWRWRGQGTQDGPLGPFPATHGRMEITIIGMHRFEGALVAETWTSWDNVAALTHFGLLGPS